MSFTKSARARALGVARSTLYYAKKKEVADWQLKCRIEETLRTFPGYGYRRVALYLRENKKKVQRVMQNDMTPEFQTTFWTRLTARIISYDTTPHHS